MTADIEIRYWKMEKKELKEKKKRCNCAEASGNNYYHPTSQVQFLVSKTLQSDKPFIDPIRMKTDTTQKL